MSTRRSNLKGKRVGARRSKHVKPQPAHPGLRMMAAYRHRYEHKYASMFWRTNLQRMAARKARRAAPA